MTGARRLQEGFTQFRLHGAVVAADRRMAQELAEVKRRISEATSSGSSNIAVWPQPVSIVDTWPTVSANLDLVRSLYAARERGDWSSVEWAHPEIEYVLPDGPDPGHFKGIAEMAEAGGND